MNIRTERYFIDYIINGIVRQIKEIFCIVLHYKIIRKSKSDGIPVATEKLRRNVNGNVKECAWKVQDKLHLNLVNSCSRWVCRTRIPTSAVLRTSSELFKMSTLIFGILKNLGARLLVGSV